MRFGSVDIDCALGAILAHQCRAGAKRFSKGHVLTQSDIAVLKSAGHEALIVAQLSEDDLGEDQAATLLAPSLVGSGVYTDAAHTGRVNLRAACDGLFHLNEASISAVNSVDPMITLATLAPFSRVKKGDLVATIKIIAFGVAENLVTQVMSKAVPLEVTPFKSLSFTLIQTELAGTKASVLDKTVKVTHARIEALNGTMIEEKRLPHDKETLTQALNSAQGDMVLIFGASAVCDGDDIIPSAIQAAGGTIERIGMPVDPGNLLVLGHREGAQIIGAPGCARSPKENGFDWVLARLCAGIAVTSRDIAAMGIGGLLQEIASRPKKREA